MAQDYISYIRSKVGHDKILLNFAGGILADADGNILLQRRSDKGSWAIPGGAMELGESSIEAAVREFAEETGIKVSPKRLLNVYTKFDECYPNGDEVQTIVFLYEFIATDPYNIDGFHNEETVEVRFFSQDEISHLERISDKHRLMLDEYFADSFAMGR
ncbi:NUDIX hydrolase [Streptococcus caprae]|uniref:NUDIX hydrolase n=1 Tax=Streptococcus caprae TaxID=1640501 RepID=A0ABV8CU82_9STRE